MAEGNRCNADGCNKPTRSGRNPWCEMHYYRLRRRGTLTANTWHRRGPCQAEGCDLIESHRGYCSRHEARVRRHGDPAIVLTPTVYSGPANGWWAGDEVGYTGAHDRLRNARGSAGLKSCVGCGCTAAHWSYDHGDPNEKQSRFGPYSTDFAHYDPRCVACHKAFDLQHCAVEAS